MDPADVTSGESSARRTRLRRFAEPALLAVGAGAVLVAIQITGSGTAPADRPAPPPASAHPSGTSAPISPHRLIAPRAAAPGDRITVLAYRNRRLCGGAELRFDGTSIAARPAGDVASPDPGRMEMFLSVRLPSTARPGRHEIELYGPVPGEGQGAICADAHEHQAQIDTTTITLAARPSGPHP